MISIYDIFLQQQSINFLFQHSSFEIQAEQKNLYLFILHILLIQRWKFKIL